MKITTFNPIIITKEIESTVALFEALGFEKRHAPGGTSATGNEYTDYRMTDASGFHVDVAYTGAELPRDITGIRINVDDFNEAYELLTQKGFKSVNGRPATETESSKGVLLFSPSGVGIVLAQHIKN